MISFENIKITLLHQDGGGLGNKFVNFGVH
jgi:hypothetical protein